MAEKWVKTIFADHGVNRKVVDNVENYPNVSQNLKIKNFSRKQLALRQKSARNTSFRC